MKWATAPATYWSIAQIVGTDRQYASNKDIDYQWLMDNKIAGCEIKDVSDEITQIAVQGKKAEEAFAREIPEYPFRSCNN